MKKIAIILFLILLVGCNYESNQDRVDKLAITAYCSGWKQGFFAALDAERNGKNIRKAYKERLTRDSLEIIKILDK